MILDSGSSRFKHEKVLFSTHYSMHFFMHCFAKKNIETFHYFSKKHKCFEFSSSLI